MSGKQQCFEGRGSIKSGISNKKRIVGKDETEHRGSAMVLRSKLEGT